MSTLPCLLPSHELWPSRSALAVRVFCCINMQPSNCSLAIHVRRIALPPSFGVQRPRQPNTGKELFQREAQKGSVNEPGQSMVASLSYSAAGGGAGVGQQRPCVIGRGRRRRLGGGRGPGAAAQLAGHRLRRPPPRPGGSLLAPFPHCRLPSRITRLRNGDLAGHRLWRPPPQPGEPRAARPPACPSQLQRPIASTIC